MSQQERTYFEHTLAGQLWIMGSGAIYPGDRGTRTTREFIRPKTVTYVTGTFRNPCLPAVPPGVMARPVRFELTTPCSGGMYSIHLSYGRAVGTPLV